MFDSVWDWVFLALPWRVQLGCLVVAVLAIVVVLLWYHYG